MNKQQRDNRANQMNPNNIAYYKSRMGNTSKKQTTSQANQQHKKSTGNYNQKQATKNNYTGNTKNNHAGNTKNVKVVHVHNNHTYTEQNLGYLCPLCGRAGKLHTTLFGMKCDHCGGRFGKDAVRR